MDSGYYRNILSLSMDHANPAQLRFRPAPALIRGSMMCVLSWSSLCRCSVIGGDCVPVHLMRQWTRRYYQNNHKRAFSKPFPLPKRYIPARPMDHRVSRHRHLGKQNIKESNHGMSSVFFFACLCCCSPRRRSPGQPTRLKRSGDGSLHNRKGTITASANNGECDGCNIQMRTKAAAVDHLSRRMDGSRRMVARTCTTTSRREEGGA